MFERYKDPNKISLLREIVEYGPTVFLFVMALAILNYEVSNVHPSKYQIAGIAMERFALTAIFPLFWLLLHYYFRARDSQRLQHPRRTFGIIAAVALGLPILLYLFARPSYMPDEQITALYEYAQFLWLALMLAHCTYKRGLSGVVLFYGIGFLYGLILENSGIILGYFGESQYRYYLGCCGVTLPAPLATQVGWCIMFYVAIANAEFFESKIEWLRDRPLRMALLATAIGITLDLQIDPLASLSGLWWKWNPALPAVWLGVPLLNYVAWFAAFMPFSYAYFYYRRQPQLSPWARNRRLLVILPWLLPAVLLIGGLIMALAEGGFDGPTFDIVRAFLYKVMPY